MREHHESVCDLPEKRITSHATAEWFNGLDRTAERSALEPWAHVQIQWPAAAPPVVASSDGDIGGVMAISQEQQKRGLEHLKQIRRKYFSESSEAAEWWDRPGASTRV